MTMSRSVATDRSSAEDTQRLAQWNRTQHPYPDQATVHELFDTQANATPDRTALIFETKSSWGTVTLPAWCPHCLASETWFSI